MNKILSNEIVVFSRENGQHVSANYNHALIYASYSGYRDPRLTDNQVKSIIEVGVMPGYWDRFTDYL